MKKKASKKTIEFIKKLDQIYSVYVNTVAEMIKKDSLDPTLEIRKLLEKKEQELTTFKKNSEQKLETKDKTIENHKKQIKQL